MKYIETEYHLFLKNTLGVGTELGQEIEDVIQLTYFAGAIAALEKISEFYNQRDIDVKPMLDTIGKEVMDFLSKIEEDLPCTH